MYELILEKTADGNESGKEVISLAKHLIQKNHQHLMDANISLLWRDREWKRGDGYTILGKASKRNEIDKLLSNRHEDFIIILVKPSWEKKKAEENEALLDHELCHCGVFIGNDGSKKWILRGHPIEEFPENLARYEFKRKALGELIQNPPSPIVVKQEKSRKLRPQETEEDDE